MKTKVVSVFAFWAMVLVALVSVSWAVPFAGESIELSSGNYATFTNPNQTTTQTWWAEFQLHDFTTPGTQRTLWYANGYGVEVEYRTDGNLIITDKRDTVSGSSFVDLAGRDNVLIRIIRNHEDALFSVEVWNVDGTDYVLTSSTITSESAWIFSGGGVGGATSPTASMGFLRLWRGTSPPALGSKPPTTTPPGTNIPYASTLYTHLRFDNNLTDSSANGFNGTATGSPTYATTPIGAGVFSKLKTLDAPTWTDHVSIRAGHNGSLDGTASYSMIQTSDVVSWFWQRLSGPSGSYIGFSPSHTVSQPEVNGLTFGSNIFQLTVTDQDGNIANNTLGVGSVATDSQGIVISSSANVEKIFGPMIAYGQNPWEFQDQSSFNAATARAPGGASEYPAPVWLDYLPGTVTYTPATLSQPAQTTLNGSITSTDTTIVLTDASLLDWSSLPSIIMVMAINTNSPIEEIRICNRVGNTLTVCYDGRGWRQGLYERVAAPQAWASGSTVRQVKTVGTSSTFLTDFCPAGPGEAGAVFYSTGTVSVTAGSASITGSGTAWNGTLESRRIRISGTTGGGATPFVFFSTVLAIPGATSITMSRVWPSTADTASGLSYAVLGTSPHIARNWVRPDATNGVQNTGISACMSDTQMYNDEILTSQSGAQTAQNYGLGAIWVSDFGPNYYDEVLAHYAMYFRSGDPLFLSNARTIGDYWMGNPGLDDGWVQQFPRRTSLTGAVAAAVLDGATSNWYGIRKTLAARGEGAATNPCYADIRETAYLLSWVGLDAMFDPDNTTKNTSKGWLDDAVVRDGTCRNAEPGAVFDAGYESDNSYPTPYFGSTGAYTMTAGSSAVTGTGFTSAICNKVAGITATVVAGSVAVTGSGFVSQPLGKIVIFATRGGQPYLYYSTFTYNSGASITLPAVFDGDSGTYSGQIESDTLWLVFASGVTDYGNLGRFYACTFNSSTSITLDRAWEGSNGTFGAWRYQEAGYGTQPFLLGIRTLAEDYAQQGADGATATTYQTYAALAAGWILDTGFDVPTGGLHYARGWRGCEPTENPRLNCTYGTSDSQKQAARFLNGEAQNAMRLAYESDPSPTVKQFGDEFYGAQWGCCGPYYDSVYLSVLNDTDIWDYKWLGFMFGIGMSHQWPAVRLGGTPPEQPQTMYQSIRLPSNGYKARINTVRPSGETTTQTCTGTPNTAISCTWIHDLRQGADLVTIQILDNSDNIVATGRPFLAGQ